MAYAPPLIQKKKEEQLTTGTEAGVVTGSGTGTAGAGTVQTAPATGPSGRFTNLQAYINANTGNAAGLGSKVANVIGSKAGEAESAIAQNRSALQSQVNAGVPGYSQADLDAIIANPTHLTEAQQRIARGEYSGPTGFTYSDVAGAGEKIRQAQETARLAESGGGQQELLSQVTPGASRGALKFNQLLLGLQPAQSQIQAATQRAAGLKEDASDILAQGQNAVTQAQQRAATAKDVLKDRIVGGTVNTGLNPDLSPKPVEPSHYVYDPATGTYPDVKAQQPSAIRDITQSLMDRVARVRSEAARLDAQARSALQRAIVAPTPLTAAEKKAGVAPRTWGTLTDQQLTNLGMTRGQFNTLQAVAKEGARVGGGFKDPLNNVNFTTRALDQGRDINWNTVATADEVARYNALAQLAGVSDPWIKFDANAGKSVYNPLTSKMTNFDWQKAIDAIVPQINQIRRTGGNMTPYVAPAITQNVNYGDGF